MKASIQIKIEFYSDNQINRWYARINTFVWGCGETPQKALEKLKRSCWEN